MKAVYSDDFNVGILGGGQLGRMLIQSSVGFNVNIHCIDPDPEAPCKDIAKTFTVASLNDFDAVYAFGKNKDVVSVEIENVNIEALQQLENEGVKVFPQARVLSLIKDKGLQKAFYKENNIPTAPFVIIENQTDLEKNLTFLPFAQKLRTGGYDGKGVVIHRDKNSFKTGFNAPSVLEKFVPFKKELALIIARNEKGETKSFPLVECEFNPKSNLVEFLFSPAEVNKTIEDKAKKIAEDIVQKLHFVGLLAVEFFLDENDELLVNEIAPRPHNSGHHTINCNVTSQFEQHLRSVLNLPLGDTKITQAGVMINLVGEGENTGKAIYEGYEKALSYSNVHLHLYGKKNSKPNRKMGHITIGNMSLNEAKKIAREIQSFFKVKA